MVFRSVNTFWCLFVRNQPEITCMMKVQIRKISTSHWRTTRIVRSWCSSTPPYFICGIHVGKQFCQKIGMWITIIWKILIHRNEVIFRQRRVDPEEIFGLVQLSMWSWLKHKMPNVNFSHNGWCLCFYLCLKSLWTGNLYVLLIALGDKIALVKRRLKEWL